MQNETRPEAGHSHVFLGADHERSERRTWWVIWLCGAMMVTEIVGGWLFGSIALVADGLHMSTHAGAMLLAALAYRYARQHAKDPRFSFGTGKLGDLAGFTSAIILAMIALLIGFEAVSRLLSPVPIHFAEAIPIACLGLVVNIVSALLLSGGHDHGHSHGHGHHHGHHDHDDERIIETDSGEIRLEVFEDRVPPRFRLRAASGLGLPADAAMIETLRPGGTRQSFGFVACDGYLESTDEIPEPHEFTASVKLFGQTYDVAFEEHEHASGAAGRDNNMRAAVVHVAADAAVSVLVIVGLLLARAFGWLWMDPLVGIVGAAVIASWAVGLIRDTGGILLDMTPDRGMEQKLRDAIERDGDELTDLHLWRLGPGHLGAILSITTHHARTASYYRECLARFKSLSHLTIEVQEMP
ncbi:MAG: CDF family Co(II)/Ni(II) efflux transporter DmeF [Rhodospirillales bacterium]|nr:CDF family Co(II)/Ni(II) efflux transporter DmeF [Rhodospirillales bacterium]MDE2318806.1 CDF family Co(II)/Ni(II) efflux transporter DmeF [Rhodospirillales bacterium]